MTKKSIQNALSSWNILLLMVVATLIFLPAVSEYFSAKRDLVQLWHEQGHLLSETILNSADRIVMFDQQTKLGNRERQLDFASYIRTLDSLNYPNIRSVRQYARREARMSSILFDPDGSLKTRGQVPVNPQATERIQKVLRHLAPGKNVYFLSEQLTNPSNRQGLIIRRSNNRGFIVLMAVMRENTRGRQNERHLHTWMDRLSGQPSIEYIILLRDSIRLATSGPLPSDFQLSKYNASQWRIRTIAGKEVFEYIQSGPSGLRVMIGMPTTALDRLQHSLIRRLIINSLLLLFIGSVLVIYLIKKQNFSYLQNEYAHISTYNTSVLESIEEGIVVLNQDRTISVFNPAAARCLSTGPETVKTKHISDLGLVLPADIIASFEAFENLNEVPLVLQQGDNKIDLLITANVASLQEEKEIRQIYIILLRDNSTQRELQEFRNRRSKLMAMGELASRVAHEIRNPLNGIAVLAQRIQKEFKPASGSEDFMLMTGSIRGESNRINEIIEAFLSYARTPELKFQSIGLNEWFEAISPLLLALGNLKIEPLPQPDLQLYIDPDQMQQALVNLVKNGIEASAEEVILSVVYKSTSNEICMRIDDLGPGIQLDSGEHVFDLYYTTKQSGSGLGLSIVEKIVTAHKGIVRFDSPYKRGEKMVRGTRFEIILPLTDRIESA